MSKNESNETKLCKKCKEEIKKGAKKCPKCGANQGMPFFLKALILFIVIIICVVGCMSSCANSVDESIKEVKKSYKDKNGKTEFKLNEVFENSYEKITMTEVNLDFKDYSEFSEPTEGKKYIMAKFEVENINKDNDELYVSSLFFNCSVDNEVMESAYVGNDKYKELGATVGIGKKTVGYLFYEVPQDANNIEIDYEAEFWTDGNSIKFILN